MGRFESTVEFYARYREPYSALFFQRAAERVGLRGSEHLLDVGCGPGLLAIGFARYVATCTGIDPEPAMIAAASSAAAEAGVALQLLHGRIEEFAPAEQFELVTIGRAIHWLDRQRTLAVLEQIVPVSGHILICGSTTLDSAPWVKLYDQARRARSTVDENKYRPDLGEWFAGSAFREFDKIEVVTPNSVTVAELIGRALSKSNTSPEVLGKRRASFEAELTHLLEPYAENGVLQEQVASRAAILVRK